MTWYCWLRKHGIAGLVLCALVRREKLLMSRLLLEHSTRFFVSEVWLIKHDLFFPSSSSKRCPCSRSSKRLPHVIVVDLDSLDQHKISMGQIDSLLRFSSQYDTRKTWLLQSLYVCYSIIMINKASEHFELVNGILQTTCNIHRWIFCVELPSIQIIKLWQKMVHWKKFEKIRIAGEPST